ncbi:MAG: protein kinase [Kofleriaceae bacterium]
MPLELEETATAEPKPAAPSAGTPALAFTETQGGPPPAGPGTGTLTEGRQLAHFRIESLLGAGGMGEVFLATDLALDRPVALKVVAQGSTSSARRERLIREARAQARIYHPNVCHIYYIGEADGLLFFAMELVTGRTFSELLAAGPVDPEQALELVRMAALGLREATRCGFTHRDIKPSNLMLDQHGNVKVLDFGLVAGGGDHEVSGGSVEQTSMAGTPLYMAPEQGRGEAIDFRADIYALGATLFHLISGKPPFAGDSLAELTEQHSSAERPALVRKDLTARALAPIAKICARMMAKEPSQRYASYDDLIRELELVSSAHSKPAGATARFAAAAIDCLILLPALLGVSFLGERIAPGVDSGGFISITLLFAGYRWITTAWLGRSLGQAIFELEVVSMTDGGRPSRVQLLRRVAAQSALPLAMVVLWLLLHGFGGWVARFANAGPPLAFLALLLHVYFASMRRAQRRTWWDRGSDTLVRYRVRPPVSSRAPGDP